jgi:hypothetical protein
VVVSLLEPDFAYAAGVVDVRGYMSYRQLQNDVVLPSLSVTDKSLPLVKHLCTITDMKPVGFERNYNRAGCGEHCPEPHVHVQAQWWRWIITGAKCTVVLAALLPYLRVQRDLAQQLIEAGREAPYKPATVRKLHELGWPTNVLEGREPQPSGPGALAVEPDQVHRDIKEVCPNTAGAPMLNASLLGAQLVSSLTIDGKHMPILDLDFPHSYVPSSTRGHAHLYLNVAIRPWRWRVLQVALWIAKVQEPGYSVWSLRRGANFVRLRGERKRASERGVPVTHGWVRRIR